jgi:hypothetical protein
MEYDLSANGIVIRSFKAMQDVIHINAPGTVPSIADLEFSQGGAMASVLIAEYRVGLGVLSCPWIFTAAMRAKPGIQDRISFQVPEKDPFLSRMDAHVSQQAELSAVRILNAEFLGLFCFCTQFLKQGIWIRSLFNRIAAGDHKQQEDKPSHFDDNERVRQVF